MKTTKTDIYGVNFRSWITKFLNGIYSNLEIDPDHKKLISVSAGVDSIALFHILTKTHKNLEVIHFNHGTRPEENKKEEELVFNLCTNLNIKCHVIHLNMDFNLKNFEAMARKERRFFYKKFIDRGYIVYTAHHLDDSFEWSLMQRFNQSSLRTTLGIPVFNNNIIRPFMCVSKKQIYTYARREKLVWIEDSSNLNVKYLRNYIRHKTIPSINSRFNKALKHYVSQSNELAMKLNLHYEISNKLSESNESFFVVKKDRLNRFEIRSNDFIANIAELKLIIQECSTKDKGKIHTELLSFLTLQKNLLNDPKVLSQKGPFRGPHQFSGGVRGFIYKDTILIMSDSSYQESLQIDQDLEIKLKSTEIPSIYRLEIFPYLQIDFNGSIKESSKLVHALLPKTSHWLKRNNVCYAFGKQLS